MKIRYTDLGDTLNHFMQHTNYELRLVAPFIKYSVIEKILENVHEDVSVICVTRWHPQEIATGVSDIEIWPYLKNRENTSLWLKQNLHAKYYRSDNNCWIGSANLTNSALGWHTRSNLELLVHVEYGDNNLRKFENTLLSNSVQVTDAIYQDVLGAVDYLPRQNSSSTPHNLQKESVANTPRDEWIPSLRHPDSLFDAYTGNWSRLSTNSQIAAYKDLEALRMPPNLEKIPFNKIVGALLVQQPIVQTIDNFVSEPRRFGAVKNLIASRHYDIDPNITWQTLMRWMLYFLPDKYIMTKPNYSEIFSRRKQS